MKWLLPLLLLLAACASDDDPSGTSVGNPGFFGMRAAQGDGVVVLDGLLPAELAIFSDCAEGDEEEVPLDEIGMGDAFEVPSGTYCRVEIVFYDDLDLALEVPALDEEDHGFLLAVPEIVVFDDDGFVVDDDHDVLLEIGQPGWLVDSDFELDEDDFWVDEDIADGLTTFAADSSQLFDDVDGDGELDDSERDIGPVAAGSDVELESGDGVRDSTPVGCADSGSLAFFPLLLLGFRYRPRTSRI